MPAITTRLFTNAELPDDLRALHVAWDKECFTVPNDYQWARPQWHIWVYAEHEPVSYVGIFARDCMLDDRPLRMAGIGSVMTPIAHRQHGYASVGLEHANRVMHELTGAPFAQLVTDRHLIPFYEKFGWQHVTDPTIVTLPDGSTRPYSSIVMIKALGEEAWPGGTLDLCGIPW